MRFSLIIGTLNRHEELKFCLDSIAKQTFSDFQVIIIDQNETHQTQQVVEQSKIKNIIYKKVPYKGLSRARNDALKIATGEYFCLIDDDAFYPPNYLSILDALIKKNKSKKIYSGYMWNSITNKSFVNYDKIKHADKLSTIEVIRYCPSPCLSFPMQLTTEIGYFDESFGVGSRFGACEETDYLLRALNIGYSVYHCNDIKVIHPHVKLRNQSYLTPNLEKITSYAIGFGALSRKHHKNKKMNLYYLITLFKDIIKILAKSIIYKYELQGHVKGFFLYKKAQHYTCNDTPQNN